MSPLTVCILLMLPQRLLAQSVVRVYFFVKCDEFGIFVCIVYVAYLCRRDRALLCMTYNTAYSAGWYPQKGSKTVTVVLCFDGVW